MPKYIIKPKDGSGFVQGLAQNKNNKKKMIIISTTDIKEAQTFSTRKEARTFLRGNRFATSNYIVEFLESTGPRNLEFLGCREYGEE